MASSGEASTLAPESQPSPATFLNVPRNSISVHNQSSVSSFNSVLAGPSRKHTRCTDSPTEFAKTLSEKLAGPWIEHAFEKLECGHFIPVHEDSERCGCGRALGEHSQAALSGINASPFPSRFAASSSNLSSRPAPGSWNINDHTLASKTDAFGQIVFQGGAHAHKAHYVRLAYDSDPDEICYLLEKVWVLPPPRLVITVHGGMRNFEIHDKLGRLFREGLLKAAQTTGAWILTHGIDSGVVRHVARALDEAGISARMRSRVVIIGIVAWGVLKGKKRLIGKDTTVAYDQHTFHSKTGWGVLNDRHSYFLLVDNGTNGRHGAEVALRRKLEEHLADTSLHYGARKVPMVCTVLEGGSHTIAAVNHYLNRQPEVPVIVCEGSGRAADLLAFAKRMVEPDGRLPSEVKIQLESMVSNMLSSASSDKIVEMIEQCARHEQQLTVFRLGESKEEDVDHAILTAILKKQNLLLPDQLALALAWDRVDVARACLASSGRSCPSEKLHQAMTDSLRLNRDEDSMNSVRLLDPEDNGESVRYLTLPDIGEIIERLMGDAYKCPYSTRPFRAKYDLRHRRTNGLKGNRKIKRSLSKDRNSETAPAENDCDFAFPFNELMIWAVLSRRAEMARCMWQHGEDALLKCQTAIRLYKSIANLAEQEYLELEVAKTLREHAAEFKRESLLLLEHCHQTDAELTVSLLTAEMPRWGHHTVLSLAVLANNKAFLAHQCCQLLLAELWHGGIRLRSRSNIRVLFGLLCPPAALTLAYRIKRDEANLQEIDHRKKDEYKQHRSCSKRFRPDSGVEWTEKSDVRPRSLSHQPQIERVSELRKFPTAPITKFWAWAFFFHVFLIAFSNVLIVKFSPIPTNTEWALTAYMFVFSLEHFRKLIALELSWKERIRVFFNRYWNLFTTFAIFLFFLGFALRYNSGTQLHGRAVLCCSNVMWHMKTLEYLSIHPLLGPYIHMGGKMVVAMSYIVILLVVSMAAFGVTKNSMHEPGQEWNWILIRNIFYKPYFMLYGEVYAGEIDPCNDLGPDEDQIAKVVCVIGGWVPPALMVLFLLVSNILLINMLIAIFNNIFNDAITKSQEIWLFERYQQVLEYTDTPFWPPPFTILPLCYRTIKKCFGVCKRTSGAKSRNRGAVNSVMKSFLDDDGMRRVHDFEEDCMDDMMRERRRLLREGNDATLRQNAEQVETIAQKCHEIAGEGMHLRHRLAELERLSEHVLRLQSLENNENEIQFGSFRRKYRNRLNSSSISINADLNEMEKSLSDVVKLYRHGLIRRSEHFGAREPIIACKFVKLLAGPSRKHTRCTDSPTEFAKTLSEKLAGPWIEHAFQKLECGHFIPVHEDSERCGCGSALGDHSQAALSGITSSPLAALFSAGLANRSSRPAPGSWNINDHTMASKTDAFGQIVFQGGAHAHKAHYVRLAYDSDPDEICYLLEKVWVLPPPRLVITVHGGMSNFEVHEKLGRLFREGLLKAAQTTGAWILTHGIDSGVVRHVARALDEAGISARMRSRVVIIGIVAWGVLKGKKRLIGKDTTVAYDQHTFHSKTGWGVLNDRHSYFLLVDNGTNGRHGAEVALRRKLEEHLADTSLHYGARKVPMVCTVLEGGSHTIAAVNHYLNRQPEVPVIVCDGSGRAADLLAYAKRMVEPDGRLPSEVKIQLESMVSNLLHSASSDKIIGMIEQCVRHEQQLTVFRLGESKEEDVDHAILTAILKKQNLLLPDQLALALAWNRVDVARACLASSGRSCPSEKLHQAMTDSLRLNRVEFVECLLENGVSMKSFLTIERLEQLYNMDEDSMNSVRLLDPEDNGESVRYLTLPDIGEIIERLMGDAYKCPYSTRPFRSKYDLRHRRASGLKGNRRVKRSLGKDQNAEATLPDNDCDFAFPFNELMIWAVLSRRAEMARCMWHHGEDALLKCQTAIRLYKSIANLAEQEYLELEVAKTLREHAAEFKRESLLLLEHCHQTDAELTVSLLTAEMPRWGHHTVLSLAVLANNKAFLAHQCCQLLLAELWHGGIRLRSRSNIRVLFGLLCPPAALTLAYRVKRDEASEEKAAQKQKEEAQDAWKQVIWGVQESRSSLWRERNKSVGGQIAAIFKKSIMGKTTSTSSVGRGQRDSDPILEWSGPRKVTFGQDLSTINRKASVYQSCESFRRPDSSLSWIQKWHAFYTAPITKFWAWAFFFHVFLIAFSNVLLVKFSTIPTNTEWALTAYMFVFSLEHCRKLITLELPWKERIRVFFNRYWNLFTTFAIFLFFLGLYLRYNLNTQWHGRAVLCCSNVMWHMKTLEYLSIHPLLGPYIHTGGKMVMAMSYIVVLLVVSMAAFGVSKVSIHAPGDNWNWILIRNIFYKPYFMLYGEVYAGDIDPCNDEGQFCMPGSWVPAALMVLFLLVSNILLINMLIAIFNNIFNDAITKSQEIWLFERYQQVLEYTDTPFWPPPFTILPLCYRTLKKCFGVCKRTSGAKSRNRGAVNSVMKSFLDDDGMRRVHDFEEDCMDDMMRERRRLLREGNDATLRQNAEQVETIAQKCHEIAGEGLNLRHRLAELERLWEHIARLQALKRDMREEPGLHYDRNPSPSSQSLPDTNAPPATTGPRERHKKPMIGAIAEGIPANFVAREHPQKNRVASFRRKYRTRLNSSSISINADLNEMEKSLRCRDCSTPIHSLERPETPRKSSHS
ncbi:unnamed protein product, partial [Mesorhabditis spiculigera]